MNFKKLMLRPLMLVLMLLPVHNAMAQEIEAELNTKRPISSTYALEIGRRHSLATYLSPVAYHGIDIALSGNWRKQMPFNPRWVMQFRGMLDFSDMRNPAGNASMQMFDAEFSWGMEYTHLFSSRFKVGVGGAFSAHGGLLYLHRNSNNPVNAMARAGLDLTASASYPSRIGRMKITLFDNITLPTLGAFFCPEYGETYYEIYLGNHKGLAHCGWWGNNFGLDNLLGAELHFGCRSMVLGWRYELDTTHINNLDTQLWRHSAVIGVKF